MLNLTQPIVIEISRQSETKFFTRTLMAVLNPDYFWSDGYLIVPMTRLAEDRQGRATNIRLRFQLQTSNRFESGLPLEQAVLR